MSKADDTPKVLKLVAFDADDLTVISAATQDMVIKTGEMTYLPTDKRFALVGNRFAWEVNADRKSPPYERRRTGVQVTRVMQAQLAGVDRSRTDDVLELLSIVFEMTDEPAGTVTFAFAGGATVRLLVECLELAMADLGGAWTTDNLPRHPGSEP
ncbi:MAG: DUF2948 family protein [Pseudomonadota bacterium]